MTQKVCTVDLTSQLIENLNTQSKTTIKLDKLLNKDRNHARISKEEIKTLWKRLALYAKAAKIKLKHRISCLNWIE